MSTKLEVPTTTATKRLVQSRAMLRQAMLSPPVSRTSPGVRRWTPEWLEKLKSIPLVTVLTETLASWWMQHPLRVASLLGAETASALVQPLARRNPLGLALASLAVGGLLVWGRPWRWIVKPALFAGIWPQLLSKVMAHLPLASWLAALVPAPGKKSSDQTTAASNLPSS